MFDLTGVVQKGYRHYLMGCLLAHIKVAAPFYPKLPTFFLCGTEIDCGSYR